MLGRVHDCLEQTEELKEGSLKGGENFTHEQLEDDNTDPEPECAKNFHKPICDLWRKLCFDTRARRSKRAHSLPNEAQHVHRSGGSSSLLLSCGELNIS